MESVCRLLSNIYSCLCCLLFGLLSADVKRDGIRIWRRLTCSDNHPLEMVEPDEQVLNNVVLYFFRELVVVRYREYHV